MPARNQKSLSSSMRDLSVKSPPARAPVANSWDEDDSSSDSSDTETESTFTATPRKAPTLSDYPSAPPPTPSSRPPSSSSPAQAIHSFSSFHDPSMRSRDKPSNRPTRGGATGTRPEKTTATASRLIAGALGVKAPKRTEEERKYDRAMRENEGKRREREREEVRRAEAEKQRAIKAVWDD